MSERQIDHSWEALVKVTGVNPTQARGELNYTLGQIRQATEYMDLGDQELAMLIEHRASLYRQLMPDVMLTPPALWKWWDRVEGEAKRVEELAVERDKEQKERTRKVTNARSYNNCTTCGGDSWVIVRQRPVGVPTVWMSEHPTKYKPHPQEKGFDESAPCPVCNTEPPVMQNFWDGRSWEYGDAPGELRIA
jgi:hypothetical protein